MSTAAAAIPRCCRKAASSGLYCRAQRTAASRVSTSGSASSNGTGGSALAWFKARPVAKSRHRQPAILWRANNRPANRWLIVPHFDCRLSILNCRLEDEREDLAKICNLQSFVPSFPPFPVARLRMYRPPLPATSTLPAWAVLDLLSLVDFSSPWPAESASSSYFPRRDG